MIDGILPVIDGWNETLNELPKCLLKIIVRKEYSFRYNIKLTIESRRRNKANNIKIYEWVAKTPLTKTKSTKSKLKSK